MVSVGTGADVSFSLAIRALSPACTVDVFAGSSAMQSPGHKQQQQLAGVRFHSVPLSTQSWQQTAGGAKHIRVLRVDCEGCEFNMLADFVLSSTVCIDQILVHVHACAASAVGVEPKHRVERVHRLLSQLDPLYHVFHKEPSLAYGDGTCMEFSLGRRAPCIGGGTNGLFAAGVDRQGAASGLVLAPGRSYGIEKGRRNESCYRPRVPSGQCRVAKPCALRKGESVHFLFASTPKRAYRLGDVLTTMRLQTRVPDSAILSVPQHFKRFTQPFVPPADAVEDPLLRVNTLPRDEGPLSKFFGALNLDNMSTVIIGDDDMQYGPTMIEDFACAVAEAPYGTIYSAAIDLSFNGLGPGVMGFRGMALRAGMLRELQYWEGPAECFLADDPMITHFFATRGFQIRQLQLRSKTAFDAPAAKSKFSISKIHSPEECVNKLVQEGPRLVSPDEANSRSPRMEKVGYRFGLPPKGSAAAAAAAATIEAERKAAQDAVAVAGEGNGGGGGRKRRRSPLALTPESLSYSRLWEAEMQITPPPAFARGYWMGLRTFVFGFVAYSVWRFTARDGHEKASSTCR